MKRSSKVLFVGGIFLLATATMLWAQSSSGTTGSKYDVKNEIKVSGTVEEVKLVPGAKEGVHLILKSGTDAYLVHVAPEKFLKEMETDFAKGDELNILGCKVKDDDGSDEVLARAITKNGNELMLRDKKGTPIWALWDPGKK